MVKIVGVLYHKHYITSCEAADGLAQVLDLKLYSSRLLDLGKQSKASLFEDLSRADAVLLNISPGESCRPEIEEKVKALGIPVINTSSEGASRIGTAEELSIATKCNLYAVYGGRENYINLFRYAAQTMIGAGISFDEPRVIPWEGIFHPDTGVVFQDIDEYFRYRPKSEKGVVGLIAARNNWVNGNLQPEIALIRGLETKGFSVVPIFATLRDDSQGSKGTGRAVESFFFDRDGHPAVDAVVKFSGLHFEAEVTGYQSLRAYSEALLKRLGCPVIRPIVSTSMSIEEWRENEYGTVRDISWGIAMPEMEGMIEPIFLGGIRKDGESEIRESLESRMEKLACRIVKWVELGKKPNSEKKIVFVLNNNPCASVEATVGRGSNLDALESVADILKRLRQAGYSIDDPPEDGKELIGNIMDRKAISEFRWTTTKEIVNRGGALALIEKEKYLRWFSGLSEKVRDRLTDAWGNPPGEEKDGVPAAMLHDGKLVVTGVSFGNAIVCIQPKRGCAGPRCDGTVCKILHDPLIPPTHQYIATYKYFEYEYKADLIVHVGTHGSLEFLPGKTTGLSDDCYPDICSGDLPCLYIYNSNNPSEGAIAKRRGLATLVDHMQTQMIPGGVYDKLEELDQLLARYDKALLADRAQAHLLEDLIKDEIEKANLHTQVDLADYHDRFDQVVAQTHKVLTVIKNTQVQDGLHVFGRQPKDEAAYITAIARYEGMEGESLRSSVAGLIGLELSELLAKPEAACIRYQKNNGSILFDMEDLLKRVVGVFLEGREVDGDFDLMGYEMADPGRLKEINGHMGKILDIRERLKQSKELDSLLAGMDACFIPPGPAGVVTRGRDDVLPTGRNFYALDPDAVPTKAACEVGRRLGDRVLEKYLKEEGRYPENISIYWMSNDVMWTDGEDLGQLLYLLGVSVRWKPNGRVSGFTIIPPEELGRPRIDVTVRVSGVLRDNFGQCLELLDGAIQAVSALDEPPEINYIRKHTLENMAEDPSLIFEEASSRIFAPKPGSFGSGVSLAIYASAWKDRKDLVDIFSYFNGYSYGRAGYGKAAWKQLHNCLKTVEITYSKVASDENDLLARGGFGAHGGLTAAARELSGHEVRTYYGDTREVSNVEIRTLTEELNRVVRGKLLNPRWIEGQKEHGYTGATNISRRVERLYGWESTTDEVDGCIFDDIVKTFIADEENRKFFMDNNPWALEEMARRLKEAYERKLWTPEEGLIGELTDAYLELEGFMEEDMGEAPGDFQGGEISIVDLNELESYRENIQEMRKNTGGQEKISQEGAIRG